MKIVSTTIAGPGSEQTIARAIGSVAPLVDEILILPNCLDPMGDIRIIDAAAVGIDRPVHAHSFTWQGSFADARNRALDMAANMGADWCLWVDTDEWLEYAPGFDLRSRLEGADVGAFLIEHASGSYSQPRLIRVPCAERWQGRTHECLAAFRVGQAPMGGIRFNEHEKTPEQLTEKFLRDATILQEEVDRDQNDARSWFYLAETRKNLGDVSGAIRAYDRRAMLKGWNEESAWACYRAAECLIELGFFEHAIERCVTGLGLHAGVAELAWLAGWCNHKLKRWEQAILWCQMAVAGGEYRGLHFAKRIGFRHPPALYEAPYDVIRHAARELGLHGMADLAERELHTAMKRRHEAAIR